MTSDIDCDLSGGVLTVTLNRPSKRNALSQEMYGVLADSLERASSDPQVRVVVIRAHGPMFTAGNDLSEFAAISTRDGADALQAGRFIEALTRCDTPIVAAVQGRAVGIGTTMLLHCDIVLLAEDAMLTTPFVGLALVPEAASSTLLPRLIGHPRAFEMFALNEPLDAATALSCGLANHVVSPTELHDRAHDIATRLAAQPAAALRETKRLMRDSGALSAHIDAELEVFRRQLRSPEAREAFAAFAEKRPPDFQQFT